MKITKILMLGTFIGIGLASCTNENFSVDDSLTGSVSLDVANLKPKPKSSRTRAVETADYPVSIYSAIDNEEVCAYEKASLIPNKVTMPVGQYYVVAHTPGALERIMTKPYYSGTETFEIMNSVNTEAIVTCRMANSSFTLKFSDSFKQSFTDWTISIDDGLDMALVYNLSTDGWTPATKYMHFQEEVTTLKMNFRGTTTNGSRIVTSSNLTKKNASENYDSDNEHFEGGDAIEVNLNPVENTTGEISGITLKANISFEETEEDFVIEVEDVAGSGGGDTPGTGGEGENPGGGDASSITLNLPDNQVVDALTDPSKGDTYIACENGIKSIMVKVSSSSQEMMESLVAVGVEQGVDFTSGTEVVGNENLVNLFTALGQELSVPAVGDENYTFPIGNFFLLLSVMSGEHTFDLTVTDMNDNVKSGTLVLTVE